MRHIMIAFAAFVGSSLSVSSAETFIPEIAFPASLSTLANQSIDILNLVPGMDGPAVEAALSELHPDHTKVERLTSFGAGARGVTVQTIDFLQSLSAGPEADRITAWFTGPASDIQAFAIERSVHYPEVLSAPTVATIADALLAKYGKASYNSRDFRDKPTAQLIWVFVGDDKVSCLGFGGYGTGKNCPVAWTLLEYKPQQLANLATTPPVFDYAIIAEIKTHEIDRTRSASLTVTVSDLRRRKEAAAADMQALLDEIERLHAQSSNPVGAPSL